MSLNSKLVLTTALSVCSALGCSAESLDLGNNNGRHVYAGRIDLSSDAGAGNSPAAPIHIVECEPMCSDFNVFAVAAGTVYWVSNLGTSQNNALVMRHCNADNCAASLVSSDRFEQPEFPGEYMPEQPLQVDQRSVSWLDYRSNSILSVSSENGAPIERGAVPDGVTSFAAGNGYWYTTYDDETLRRCAPDDCANTLEVFSMTPPVGTGAWTGVGSIVAQDSEHLYLAGGYPGNSLPLLRVAKDVNASFEALMQSSGADNLSTLKVQGENIYWLERAVLGQLKTCPASGCANAPRPLLIGLSGLEVEVAVDESDVYVLVNPDWYQTSMYSPDITWVSPGQILKCQLPGCTDLHAVFTSTSECALSNLVVDDRFIYFAGASDCFGGAGRHYFAVIPK